MFNICVLTGLVITIPTLTYFRGETPVTDFEMDILVDQLRMGQITVSCSDREAMRTVKYVSKGIIVVAAGFMIASQRPDADGVWRKKMILKASDVEVLDREIFSLEQRSLLENPNT